MITINGCGQAGTYEYKGLSTDVKPADCAVNSLFLELDTGYFFYFDGTNWVKMKSGDGYSSFKALISRTITEITPEMTKGITRIYTHACRGCSQLTKASVSEGVTSIGEFAFYYCSILSDLTLPEGLTTIGNCAFEGCHSLADLNLKSGLRYIGDFAFKNSGLNEITIPNGTLTIGKWAFEGCDIAQSLSLPNSLNTIGEGAFKNCKRIDKISIPNGITKIEKETFFHCEAAEILYIPTFSEPVFPYKQVANLRYVGESAFSGCHSLGNINIPNGVENLDIHAFEECSSAETLSLPHTLTNLGDFCFANCSALNTKVTIPSSLSGYMAWHGYSFSGCTSLVEVYIEDGVSRIGDGTFLGCTSLQNINFPRSLGEATYAGNIGDRAFENCTSLRRITVGTGVRHIGESAFEGCSNLGTVDLPSTISNNTDILGIGSRAFYYEGLYWFQIAATFPPTLGGNVFYVFGSGGNSYPTIKVPSGTGNSYRNADGWRNYSSLISEGGV